MAQKIITDLQLISSVVDGLNFAGDDGLQTYRLTGAQLTAYILKTGNVPLSALSETIFNGLTGVAPAGDDYIVGVDTSDGNKIKKFLGSYFERSGYATINNPADTALSTTARTTVISGTTGAIVLPDATTNVGQRFRLIHGGTNFVAYGIKTTSSQTVGGLASNVFKLMTLGEMLEVESNGANYFISGRHTNTAWVDAGAMTVTGTTTNPTKGTTSLDKLLWRRQGDSHEYHYDLQIVSGSGPGSGDYLFALPSGHSINSSKVTFYATVPGVYGVVATAVDMRGNFFYNHLNTASGVGKVIPYDATRLRMGFTTFANTGSIIGTANAPFGDTRSFRFDVTLPMTDYQP